MYTVTITFTLAGSDVGPFDLYSDADGYITPFATGISAADLLAGYTSTVVPDASTTILARSTGICTRDLYMPIVGAPTTSTTSTSSTSTSTTSTSTTAIPTSILSISFTGPSFGGPTWTFSLTNPVSDFLKIENLLVTGYDTAGCTGTDIDSFQMTTNPSIITAGSTLATTTGSLESNPSNRPSVKSQSISLIGGSVQQALIAIGGGSLITYNSGDTFMVGSTVVTLHIQGCTNIPYW